MCVQWPITLIYVNLLYVSYSSTFIPLKHFAVGHYRNVLLVADRGVDHLPFERDMCRYIYRDELPSLVLACPPCKHLTVARYRTIRTFES